MMSVSFPQLLNYHLEELIHESDRTLVYRGQCNDDAKPVILKLMRNEYPSFHELVQFRNQYAITRNLNIEGIIKPYALERYENRHLLIMEDFEGMALQEAKEDNYTVVEFLPIAIQLAEILHNLHQNRLIHKDIKPANILIHPQTKQVKIIDFSISSLLPKETQTLQIPNVLEGTLAYISPEQTGRMNRGVDYRSDFYSLGVTFYQLLTGKLPFTSDDPMELIHCHIAKIPVPVTSNLIPEVLSDIVMKLMAKNAEDRYQSALGLKCDLEKCLSQWQETGEIKPFILGEQDICDRFLIPEKLYGREKEVQSLLDAFHRVSQGKSEMFLVAGYSGVGKTAVVNEVHKPIVAKRGYFIKGKFDQFNRDIPFSAFVQAFRDLMGQLLGENDLQLQRWKDKILTALGESGQVIIQVIPELENIIGEQPPVPELSGNAAQNRFNLLFEKFVSIFATKEHPLTIFLDDLQWADAASLKLIQVLMSESDSQYLLTIGAYRDNEVFPAHPLILTLEEIKKKQAILEEIVLQPLGKLDLNQWVSDTLSCDLNLAQPLTDLIFQKTQGNPFFATQFLKGLHEDGLIEFNIEARYWQCDLAQVRELALTDDVVEFMAGRLQKLSKETQEVLKLAACIGNQFDLETLAIVSDKSPEATAMDLWEALKEGLILPQSQAYKFYQESNPNTHSQFPLTHSQLPQYKFLHDRVQQAAYCLIPEAERAIAHYQIGQLLLQRISPESQEERIFTLVNQLNYGTALITEQTERDEFAQLNLIACRKARNATAYQAGFDYASRGLFLLGEEAWLRQYEMALAFHDLAAELALLCGDFEAMAQFVETVIKQAHSLLEQVNAYRIKIQSNFAQNNLTEAIAIAQELLQQLGVTFPETPTPNDIQQAIAEIVNLIGDRDIEDLVNLPIATDEEKISIIQIANSITPAAYFVGSPLHPLLIALSVKISIQYGNTPASAFCYVGYGFIACNPLQDVDAGVKFGQLALQIVSQPEAKAVKPAVLAIMGIFILYRKSPVKDCLSLLQEGYTTALAVGDRDMAGHNAHNFCLSSFWCGQPLITLEKETRAYYNGLLQFKQLTTANYCRIYWQGILNLLGRSEQPTLLSGEAFKETELLPQLLESRDLFGLYIFSSYKLMLCYLFEEFETAKNYAVEVERYFMAGLGTVAEPGFYFYDSLIILASLNLQSEPTLDGLEKVDQNQTKLQQHWAHYAPMNHQHKVDLVEAEKCRVLGQKLEAMELYDRAIAGAKVNEYIQEEALANELAAKFYLDWGFDCAQPSTEQHRSPNGKEKIAGLYMQEAYYGYARWGAKAKVEDLETRYPQLLSPILEQKKLGLTASSTFATPTMGTISQTTTGVGEILDLASLMKASRLLSEEIELEGAIANLMQVVRENAGAETVALMLFQEQVLMLNARGTTEGSLPMNPIPVETSNAVPLSIINQVKRRRKLLLLENARQETVYGGDIYIQKHQPQSVLCLPLVARGQLIGILYLENNQCAGAFTSDRAEILNLLCSQAAYILNFIVSPETQLWQVQIFLLGS
ncbi:ATP-binding protein [Spirulina sp. 06S082]|uniref:ATP-binding protein n=1 Tax=Spirulina sp. 06S082 TaxID=3110248 RepID=UPI002B1F5092|nr:AAA family ATPase [Spirulina sp. 06S082]MEA5467255.1 AAA family ATPase [Spirulina sp. 06S082]